MRRQIAREVITTALDVVGVLAVAAGAWLIFAPAGVIVLGVACLALSRWGSR